MVSCSTGGKWVRWVEQCSLCKWIDASALDGWAENAIKLSLNKRSQQAALAAGTEPFAFVQGGDGADLSLEDILVQAFSAIQVHGMQQGMDASTGKRMSQIYKGTMAEIQRLIKIAVKNELAAQPIKRPCPFCGEAVLPLPDRHACRGSRVVS